jgi:hypothetical protein
VTQFTINSLYKYSTHKNKQEATTIPHGVDAIKNLPNDFTMNDPDKVAKALRDWVKPKVIIKIVGNLTLHLHAP